MPQLTTEDEHPVLVWVFKSSIHSIWEHWPGGLDQVHFWFGHVWMKSPVKSTADGRRKNLVKSLHQPTVHNSITNKHTC